MSGNFLSSLLVGVFAHLGYLDLSGKADAWNLSFVLLKNSCVCLVVSLDLGDIREAAIVEGSLQSALTCVSLRLYHLSWIVSFVVDR